MMGTLLLDGTVIPTLLCSLGFGLELTRPGYCPGYCPDGLTECIQGSESNHPLSVSNAEANGVRRP